MNMRAADELTLDWVKKRASGISVKEIAQSYGVGTQRVSTATNRVKRADMEHGATEADYWPDYRA